MHIPTRGPLRRFLTTLVLAALVALLLTTVAACSAPPPAAGFTLKSIPDSAVPADLRTRLVKRDWDNTTWLMYQEHPGTRFAAVRYNRRVPDRSSIETLGVYLDRGQWNFWAISIQFPFAQPQPLEFRGAWVEPYDGYMAAFGIAFHAGVARIQGKTASGWEGSVEPVNGFWLLEATASGPKDEWLLVRAVGHDGELIHVYSRPNWPPLPRWSPEG